MSNDGKKVAVVTGATSGIGLALVEKCLNEGLCVVLVSLNSSSLEKAKQQFEAHLDSLLFITADVAKREDMERVAATVMEVYGRVDVLINNAGVGAGSTIWDSSWNDWEWVISVNLMGVLHGMKIFAPIMMAQGGDCYIVNNASIAGMVPYYPNAPYHMTKHAVVAMTEQMHHSMALAEGNVIASVICTGWVSDTNIMNAERNRPEQYKNTGDDIETEEARELRIKRFAAQAKSEITPMAVAEAIFSGMRDKSLYILTHPEYDSVIDQRFKRILNRH